jgi:HPt (histidine-containing phosphotransfer) domain-containing protein
VTADLLDPDVVAQLRDALGGDAFAEIVSLYVQESSRLLEELDEALAAGDAATVMQRSHSLGTSSATVGAATLAARCKDLERGARAGTLGADDEIIAELRSLHTRSVDALGELRNHRT